MRRLDETVDCVRAVAAQHPPPDEVLIVVDHNEELERELATLLAETEKRVNQYYDQQMGNVLAREVALTEKLDATIKKLGEARSTEQMARYRAEGEALQTQLAHVKGNRERDQIDLLGRLLLALDFEVRERAHRLAVAARVQGAERLAHFAVLVRAMHRDQGIGRVIAQRRRE